MARLAGGLTSDWADEFSLTQIQIAENDGMRTRKLILL